jgi:hypothetical protein
MVKHRQYTGIAKMFEEKVVKPKRQPRAKNAKRVAAGKRVWANKSDAERAAILAKLKAGRERGYRVI